MKYIGNVGILKVLLWLVTSILIIGCSPVAEEVDLHQLIVEYEMDLFDRNFYRGRLFASTLCVSLEDVGMPGFSIDGLTMSAGLFDLSNQQVLFSHGLHERLYPASTTKILTAYVALRYGDLDDMVRVGENALRLPYYAQMGGLRVGDKVSLSSLIAGIMLHSGNDKTIAIAEHISGSEAAFVELMNDVSRNIGATNSNFANSHGLHDSNQFSTIYDLYLIFQAALTDPRFVEIIYLPSYIGTIYDVYGNVRQIEWFPTNFYANNWAVPPENVTVIGGKTGTTYEAGAGVVLLNKNNEQFPFISIIMGAPTRDELYQYMTWLLDVGVRNSY